MELTIEPEAAITLINEHEWEEEEMDFLQDLVLAVEHDTPVRMNGEIDEEWEEEMPNIA